LKFSSCSSPCQFRSDKQRLMNEGQQLLRQGLEQLENFKR